MFYSPSQERAQYFPRQEGVTIIFPNKHLFAYQKKRGLEFPLSARRGRQEFFPGMTFLPGQKKKAHDQLHTAKDERKFTGKAEATNLE